MKKFRYLGPPLYDDEPAYFVTAEPNGGPTMAEPAPAPPAAPDPTVPQPSEPLAGVSLIMTAAIAVAALAAAFVPGLTKVQAAAIVGAVGAIGALAVWLWGRRKAYSPATVVKLLANAKAEAPPTPPANSPGRRMYGGTPPPRTSEH